MINEEKIHKFFSYHGTEYSINSGKIDVYGSVDIWQHCFYKMPFNFGKVDGDFDCSNNYLENLENGPEYVGGTFDCSGNKLKNLIGSPRYVGGSFYCVWTQFDNFDGLPEHIGGNFICDLHGHDSHKRDRIEIPGKLLRENINILYDKNLRKILL